jgi:hypothetical protein
MLAVNLALRYAQRFFLLNLGLAVIFCAESRPYPLKSGDFKWNSSPPLISPEEGRADRCISVKDPSVVYHDGRWHVFATIRSEKRTHQIEYLNFKEWEEANKASRHILKVSDGYFCAPEVFYFTPHHKFKFNLAATFSLQPLALSLSPQSSSACSAYPSERNLALSPQSSAFALHLSSQGRHVVAMSLRTSCGEIAETALRFPDTSQQTLRHILLLPTTSINFAGKNVLKSKLLRRLTHTTIVDSGATTSFVAAIREILANRCLSNDYSPLCRSMQITEQPPKSLAD